MTKPIKKEEEVRQNSDPKIDQDYPGFPHHPSDKKSITPRTKIEKNWQALQTRKGQKKLMAGSTGRLLI